MQHWRRKSHKLEFFQMIEGGVSLPRFSKIVRENNKGNEKLFNKNLKEIPKWGQTRFNLLEREILRMKKMKEKESLNEYLDRLCESVNQMKFHGDTIDDQRIITEFVLVWQNNLIIWWVVIKETNDLLTMVVHGLMQSLRSCEKNCYNTSKSQLKHVSIQNHGII